MDQAALSLRSYSHEGDSHEHAFVQVLLPLKGEMELEVEGRGGIVDAGHGAIVPPGDRHAFRGLGENRFAILDVLEDTADELLCPAQPGDQRPLFFLGPAIHQLTSFLALCSFEPRSQVLADHTAPLVLATLASEMGGGFQDLPARLRGALAFLHRNYTRPIGSTEMAAAANLSPSRFHALFKRWLGQTPYEYLTSLRIAKARDLLAGSELAIAEVALRAGYGDQTALTRAFRRETGTTPAQYRRALRARPGGR